MQIIRKKYNFNLKINRTFFVSAIIFSVIFSSIFFSCKSAPSITTEPEKQPQITPEDTTQTTEPEEIAPTEIIEISRMLLAQGILTKEQLANFFLLNNPDEAFAHILDFAGQYISEACAEGINSDIAFAQMCLETGFLRFGGLVQKEWHNYCGLGAIDKDNPGCIFETEQLGIRAHIQHLQAYATTEDIVLNNQLVDPRYNWVHKTKYITDIYGLTGTWAADPAYSQKLNIILTRMEEFVNK